MSSACGCTAWIFNDDGTSQFAKHQYSPNRSVSHAELEELGVLYYRMDGLDKDPKLDKLRQDRGYSNFDVVNITKDTPMEKLKIFFDEHLHEDEEIRLCLEGSGYFDLRNKKEEWVRIHCQPGDLLIMPAGIYHRFTLDENMYIKAMRLFTSAPKWIALSRSEPDTDKVESRADYSKFLTSTDGKGTPIVIQNGPQALANYPHARAYNGLIYLSGFSSRREDNTHRGATLNPETKTWDLDIAEQTHGVIENMRTVLRAAGADLNSLLDITVFLVDMAHYKGFNAVYDQYFTANSGPSRTTVAVKQLPHPNLLIEIKGIAAAPAASATSTSTSTAK